MTVSSFSDPQRLCTYCLRVKPASEFYTRRGGHHLGRCKACHKKRVYEHRSESLTSLAYVDAFDATPPAWSHDTALLLEQAILHTNTMTVPELEAWLAHHAMN